MHWILNFLKPNIKQRKKIIGIIVRVRVIDEVPCLALCLKPLQSTKTQTQDGAQDRIKRMEIFR